MAASASLITLLANRDKEGMTRYLADTGRVQDDAAARNQWFDDMNRIRQTFPMVLSFDELFTICEGILTDCPDANNALFQKAILLNDLGKYQDALVIINRIYPLMTGGKKPALFLKVQLLKYLDASIAEINDVLHELEGL
jgi:hypothetical protein